MPVASIQQTDVSVIGAVSRFLERVVFTGKFFARIHMATLSRAQSNALPCCFCCDIEREARYLPLSSAPMESESLSQVESASTVAARSARNDACVQRIRARVKPFR